jgi:nitrogen-specific signal transduction histidine kinase
VAPQVLIDFINTGPGISDEEARTLFEPKGADLELVISYGIIEQHGGMLSVKSDSKSTTFRVALPVPGDG